MTAVQCNVKNCTYNEQTKERRICTANEIQISSIDTAPDMEVGEIATATKSATSYQTQCVTFITREDNK